VSIKQRLQRWLLEKASAVAPLISFQALGQPVWTPRRYDKFAEEGYQKNIIVYKAINERMTAVQQAVWLVQRLVGGEWVDDEESDLAKLLRRPNEFQGGSAFFGALCGYDSISGNMYIEAVRPSIARPPTELHVLRPDRMKVIPGTQGVQGYEYAVGAAEPKIWDVEENAIRHVKQFHPLNDWYGLSPLEAAAYDVDIHTATLEWNKALLDNGCRPSGALVYAPKQDGVSDMLGEEDYNRLKQQIDEQYSGAGNAGRPFLLEGGLTWQGMGLSPSDMDYINSKNTTARDIVMAFDVPPMLLGLPGDNTFSNLKEARVGFWEQWVLTWLYNLRDELNAWLAPQFGAEYRIVIDEDQILALAPRREAVWDRVNKATFLSIEEKREATGYSRELKEGETVLVPATMIPAGASPLDVPTPVRAAEEGEE
jgi:HK97 family phage portal protein